MKRAKGILASLRVVESLLLNRASPTRSLHFQATHYSHSSQLFASSSSFLSNQKAYTYVFPNTHQKLHFSSKPESIVELVTESGWSDCLEMELEKSHLTTLRYETVIYVLKNLEENPQKALDFFNWVSGKNGFKPCSMIYTLMLKILANKETMKEVWIFIKKMSDEGCDIDEEMYSTVLSKLTSNALKKFFKKMKQESGIDATVTSLVDVILKSRSNDDVEKKLGEVKVKLSENTILKIIRALHQYPFKALWFFRSVGSVQSHNAVTYNGILKVLAQEQSIDEFWCMVEELKSAGHYIDIDTYTKLSRQFFRRRMLKEAVELCELMMDSPYKPLVENCSSVFREILSSEMPDLDLLLRFFTKCESLGYIFPKATYECIRKSLNSEGRSDEGKKILMAMRNVKADNNNYRQVVIGLCKARRLEEARKILDEMEEQGCVRDVKNWTILVQGYCMAGEIDQALKCYSEMLKKNLIADTNLIEVLVNSLCGNNKVDSAYTLVINIGDNANFSHWRATYKNLIRKLLGEKKLEKAINLFRLALKNNDNPPVFQLFVDYISKDGTVEDARKLLKALNVKEEPAPSTYIRILQSFVKVGRQPEARILLQKFPDHIRNHPDICL
ncbi:Pentatricopeptide repeat-containing protein [Thalictrum thalictroides]|uniref:Pentatricopeptide repeat-containing protein n=1 Tax=Thalictrum thalictroides TaxID=46969 RepID=A0A7J6W6Q3_THATH|nr:Pentatricopeptide repeat-containing protein [Thalictrum thalictroides]